MFNTKKKVRTYVAIAVVVICAMSIPLLSGFGIQPGGLGFTLYSLSVLGFIIVFLVVPYFKKQRRKDD